MARRSRESAKESSGVEDRAPGKIWHGCMPKLPPSMPIFAVFSVWTFPGWGAQVT